MQTRIRSIHDRVRDVALLALVATATFVPLGCDNGGGGSGGGTMMVQNFNLDTVSGVFLNENMVFTFSSDVDRSTVNEQTIQIRYDASMVDRNNDGTYDEPGNSNAVPQGTFSVDGNVVTFHPKLPTRSTRYDGGLVPSHLDDIANCGTMSMPRPCPLTLTFTVRIPGFPDTNVVRNEGGRPNNAEFRSSFTTVFDAAFPPSVSEESFIDTSPALRPAFVGVVLPATTTDVSPNTCVQLRFSEPLNPTTVTPDSIFLSAPAPHSGRLERVPSVPVVTQEESTSLVTLYIGSRDGCAPNPNIPLAGGVTYTVNFTDSLAGFGSDNAVVLPGSFPSFTTSMTTQGGGSFAESFTTEARSDSTATAARWGTDMAQPGQLVATAGGTGDDGPLTPTQSTSINTDAHPGDPNDPLNPPGTFNWTTINIPPGVTVTVTGSHPLRARAATATIAGRLELNGAAGGSISAATAGTPGRGGNGGPGAGRGGDGGGDTMTPGTGGPEDGMDGGGPEGGPAVGAGRGSVGFIGMGLMEAGGGGGASYTDTPSTAFGDPGRADTGGQPGSAGSPYGSRNLNTDVGLFLAGSGGGGGGHSVRSTPVPELRQSGAGGGGGGGALEIIARSLFVNAPTDPNIPTIRANGGDGGMVTGGAVVVAAGGGGGSGGAILLRAVDLLSVLQTQSGRATIQATGGLAGSVNGSAVVAGAGGKGGKGRVHFQIGQGGTLSLPPSAQLPIDPADQGTAMDRFPLGGNFSFATSTWFDTQRLFPDFSFDRNVDAIDASQIFATPQYPAERIVQYLFQGASEDPLNPGSPDPGSVAPSNGRFTDNIDEVDDKRFIRFRVVLLTPPDEANPVPGQVPTVDQLGFRFTFN